ncbi:MAG: NAD(P)H-hydrate dehydratase [Bacteroidaceae bacterium]|nr:NAD(P)H-hydrate dehydratase [Bacteroidaceae bacterium]
MTTQPIPFTYHEAAASLLPRPVEGHKGTFGTALLVCGSETMGGCAVLAARACLRSGVGKVVVHVPECLRLLIMQSVPEAIVSVDRGGDGNHLSTIPHGEYQAIAIGPGIGLADATRQALMAHLQQASDTPYVIDADALTLLAQEPKRSALLPPRCVLTPHFGELKRLMPSLTDVRDRLKAATELARSFRCHIVAKGHPTHTIMPAGDIITNTTGSDAIATAGSGDVLTGIIVGLLAQGYDLTTAATLGVYLHGLAGDLAAAALGHHSVVASDIIDYLPQAFLHIS